MSRHSGPWRWASLLTIIIEITKSYNAKKPRVPGLFCLPKPKPMRELLYSWFYNGTVLLWLQIISKMSAILFQRVAEYFFELFKFRLNNKRAVRSVIIQVEIILVIILCYIKNISGNYFGYNGLRINLFSV